MTGHCARCRGFSLALRDVVVEEGACVGAGMLIPEFRLALCEACAPVLPPVPPKARRT